MKLSKSRNASKQNDKFEDRSAEAFDRRAAELTELLKACRDLSDILHPDELYATFAGIIRNKLKGSESCLLETECFSSGSRIIDRTDIALWGGFAGL